MDHGVGLYLPRSSNFRYQNTGSLTSGWKQWLTSK